MMTFIRHDILKTVFRVFFFRAYLLPQYRPTSGADSIGHGDRVSPNFYK